MTWPVVSSRRLFASLLCMILPFLVSRAQWLEGSLKDVNNRADYLIIAPPSFVYTIQPLAAFRALHNSFSVVIVLTDSIYSQFHASAPDSSLRAFLTYAHSSWRRPAPNYVLLAGNTPLVPTHMEESYFHEFGEDSVAIDQWYVDTLSYSQFAPPTTAIGRFPAWNVDELSAMVTKTIGYETASPFAHADRFITVADSGDGGLFENAVSGLQAIVSSVWKDTVTMAVRSTSPQYKPRSEFFDLWNEGTAAVDFFGNANNVQFSRSMYFTSADIDSLQEGSSLTVCVFQSSQRFQEIDTVAMAVNLMRAKDRGGVAVLAPSGLAYASENNEFSSAWRHSIVAEPEMSLGVAVKLAKQTTVLTIRRETLLGDPALVIQHKTIASVTPPSAGPSGFQLFQNYPNPFNPTTTIQYALPRRSHVTIAVYNTLGQEVAILINGEVEPGYHEVQFNASGLASGVYIYRLRAGDFIQARKLCLVR